MKCAKCHGFGFYTVQKNGVNEGYACKHTDNKSILSQDMEIVSPCLRTMDGVAILQHS